MRPRATRRAADGVADASRRDRCCGHAAAGNLEVRMCPGDLAVRPRRHAGWIENTSRRAPTLTEEATEEALWMKILE